MAKYDTIGWDHNATLQMKSAHHAVRAANVAAAYLRPLRDRSDDFLLAKQTEKDMKHSDKNNMAVAFAAIVEAAALVAKHLEPDDLEPRNTLYPEIELHIKAALDNFEEMDPGAKMELHIERQKRIDVKREREEV